MKFLKYLSIFVFILIFTAFLFLTVGLSLVGCCEKFLYRNYTTISPITITRGPATKIVKFEFKKETSQNKSFLIATHRFEKAYDVCLSIKLKAKSGSAQLVLVRPNSTIKNLIKVSADGKNIFNGNIYIHCNAGLNKIKIISQNFEGECKLSQTSTLLEDLFDFDPETDTVENQKDIGNNTVNIEQTKTDTNLINKISNFLRNRIEKTFEHFTSLFKLLKRKFLFI